MSKAESIELDYGEFNNIGVELCFSGSVCRSINKELDKSDKEEIDIAEVSNLALLLQSMLDTLMTRYDEMPDKVGESNEKSN